MKSEPNQEITGEMIQLDEHIFQMGWFNHQLVIVWVVYNKPKPRNSQLAVYTTYSICHLYSANWMIICYLPPIKGTRNSIDQTKKFPKGFFVDRLKPTKPSISSEGDDRSTLRVWFEAWSLGRLEKKIYRFGCEGNKNTHRKWYRK